jgi:hypothetical protein
LFKNKFFNVTGRKVWEKRKTKRDFFYFLCNNGGDETPPPPQSPIGVIFFLTVLVVELGVPLFFFLTNVIKASSTIGTELLTASESVNTDGTRVNTTR